MNEFELKMYEKLFDSKHHYDNLSWIIGAPVLAVAGGLLAYMPVLKDSNQVHQVLERLVIAAFICFVLFSWQSIYQRNRIWGEAANEAIRDFERAHRIRGPGIVFMLTTLERKVVLKNTDENGVVRADPYTEVLREKSIHRVIPGLAKVVGVLAVIASFLP